MITIAVDMGHAVKVDGQTATDTKALATCIWVFLKHMFSHCVCILSVHGKLLEMPSVERELSFSRVLFYVNVRA